MCSAIALIGAKPVPLASSRIGRVLSSRRKKVPSGASMRRMSRSLIAGCVTPNSASVNSPPGMWRTCSVMRSSACGAVAIE